MERRKKRRNEATASHHVDPDHSFWMVLCCTIYAIIDVYHYYPPIRVYAFTNSLFR